LKSKKRGEEKEEKGEEKERKKGRNPLEIITSIENNRREKKEEEIFRVKDEQLSKTFGIRISYCCSCYYTFDFL